MSWDIKVDFWVKGFCWERKGSGYFNFLKEVASRSSGACLEEVSEEYGDFPKRAATYKVEHYLGLIKKEDNNGHPVWRKEHCSEKEADFITIGENEVENFNFVERDGNLREGYLNVVYYTEGEYKGGWYSISGLNCALNKAKEDLKGYNKELTVKEGLKGSIDYYKLDEGQKEDLNQDIGYTLESIEYTERKVESYKKLINIMEYYAYYESSSGGDDKCYAYIYVV